MLVREPRVHGIKQIFCLIFVNFSKRKLKCYLCIFCGILPFVCKRKELSLKRFDAALPCYIFLRPSLCIMHTAVVLLTLQDRVLVQKDIRGIYGSASREFVVFSF